MTVEYVKVFGERNTGTNFLNQFLNLNTTLTVLGHGKNDRCKERANKIYEAHRIKDAQVKRFIRERMIDAEREQEFSDNFGWKHSAPSLQKLMTSPRYNQTLFICLIRNPWRFLTSLHRRPYNLVPIPKDDFSNFIRSPFVASAREGLDDTFLPDLVTLWNLKVGAYHRLHDQSNSNVLLVYYEELVIDVAPFVSRLSQFCEINHAAIQIPQDSTKKENKTYADYRAEVLEYNPLDTMSREDASYIGQRLAKPTIEQSPYLELYESCLSD